MKNRSAPAADHVHLGRRGLGRAGILTLLGWPDLNAGPGRGGTVPIGNLSGGRDRMKVVVDTDAGVDDVLALSFLLTRREVQIEAITIVNGLAHVEPGGSNVLRLLQLAGRIDVPVFLGPGQPLPGGTLFPEDWRKVSDELPGVELPVATRRPEPVSAVDYLARRLGSAADPVTILALGPHTNLALALQRVSAGRGGVRQIFVMGGAVNVPGNVDLHGNTTAEWNLFEDPAAAQAVFTSGLSLKEVPLDATNQVPIDLAFLDALGRSGTALGKVAYQALSIERELISQGQYFAWDPLSAVALADPSAVTMTAVPITLLTQPPQAGRTLADPASPYRAEVALQADAARFGEVFLGALGAPLPAPTS